MSRKPQQVYFILADDGRVKIGIAADPTARLKGLQTGNPAKLEIVRLVEGGLAAEQWFHQRFAEHRIQGEWFKWVPEMAETHPPAYARDDAPLTMKAVAEVSVEDGHEATVDVYSMVVKKTRGGKQLSDQDLIDNADAIRVAYQFWLQLTNRLAEQQSLFAKFRKQQAKRAALTKGRG